MHRGRTGRNCSWRSCGAVSPRSRWRWHAGSRFASCSCRSPATGRGMKTWPILSGENRHALCRPRLLGAKMMEEQPHEQAIKAIRGFTGDVSTDDSVPGQPVVGVTLERSRVTDDVLVPLQNLRRLHFLNLSQTFVTDKVLGVLRAHPEIRRL